MGVFQGLANVSFNSSFLSFAAANLTGRFDIDPGSFANCPRSSGCSGDHAGVGVGVRRNRFGAPPTTAASTIQHPSSTAASVENALPTFSHDYSVHEHTVMLSNSGGVFRGTDVCCTPGTTTSVNGECLVTRSAQRGMHYVDVTNQRERFEDDISQQTTVTFFGKVLKDMVINVTDGKETCQAYCPLLDGETLVGLRLDPNATNQGRATVDGQVVEHYRWSEFDEIPITHQQVKMAQVEFYTTPPSSSSAASSAARGHASTVVPVFSETKLEPYGGPQTGSENTTYTHWVGTLPPAGKFDIAGIDACPQAKNCQIERRGRRSRWQRWQRWL
jgi:hypothetical protein